MRVSARHLYYFLSGFELSAGENLKLEPKAEMAAAKHRKKSTNAGKKAVVQNTELKEEADVLFAEFPDSYIADGSVQTDLDGQKSSLVSFGEVAEHDDDVDWILTSDESARPQVEGNNGQEEAIVNDGEAEDKSLSSTTVAFSGATGVFSPAINGIFKPTDENVNGKKVCCKIGVVPIWMWYTADSRWVVGAVAEKLKFKTETFTKFDPKRAFPFVVSVMQEALWPADVRQWRVNDCKGAWPVDVAIECVTATTQGLVAAEAMAVKDTAIARKLNL
jgi:hypothetical protein